MKKTLIFAPLALIFGFLGAWLYDQTKAKFYGTEPTALQEQVQMVNLATEGTPTRAHSGPETFNDDFVAASSRTTHSVVYVRNISERVQRTYMDWFFGGQPSTRTEISSGSGVVFTADGYIVTNNHVVADADRIEIVLNKTTYPATLVGTDPSTDLAVLKVEDEDLPAVALGSSKNVQVGEWVLAIGNPFNLTSTVTAGIVSAKGREINILQGKFPIESFIQTDAAINPGNSGGALVNRRGELVGINTAILSRTGTYTGYGFAVPVDIVKKVVNDIIEYGEVQKGFFGAEVSDLDARVAERLSIPINPRNIRGVVVTYVQKDWAADKGGLREGDVILAINGEPVNSKSNFDEELSYYSPGDKLMVKYLRGGKEFNTELTVTNREGTTGILKREVFTSSTLGAQFETLPRVERELLGISHGVRISKISSGLIKDLGITEDFIVTKVNGVDIKSPEKLIEILERMRGRIVIEGVNNKGREGYYSFFLR